MNRKLAEIRATTSMRIAGFIGQNHTTPWKRWLARSAMRLNLMQYGRDPLDFLENEDSIDHLDFEAEDEEAERAKGQTFRNKQ